LAVAVDNTLAAYRQVLERGKSKLRVGIDAHMVGGRETVTNLCQGSGRRLQSLDDTFDLVVFNVGSPWTSPQHRIRFHRLLTGNPYVRLGIELPLRSLGERLDVIHMTYAAPAWSAAPIVLLCTTFATQRTRSGFGARLARPVERSAEVDSQGHSRHYRLAGRASPDHRAVPGAGEQDLRHSYRAGPGSESITVDAAEKELAALALTRSVRTCSQSATCSREKI